MEFVVEQLNKTLHDRGAFDCGDSELNEFLKKHANQNQSLSLSRTFVAVIVEKTANKKKIYGYYSLSSGQIACDDLPDNIKFRFPKYPIPIARISRLAVDNKHQKKGIGGLLLYNALSRIIEISSQFGVYAVVVDAKNQKAKEFYTLYGFMELQNSELTLFLPVATIPK